MRSSKARGTRFGRAAIRRAAASALAGLALGCSGDAELAATQQSSQMWVGQVQDSDVKVGLAERDGAVALFFCGGDGSYTTDTRWFTDGAMLSAPFSFSESGWSVDGVMEKGSLSGNVQTDAEGTRAWKADPTDARTLAGLYEGTAPCGKLGLIVSQASIEDEPVGQGACLRFADDAAIIEQVNPVRLELSATRELVVTVPSAPDERFTVRPVASVQQ